MLVVLYTQACTLMVHIPAVFNFLMSATFCNKWLIILLSYRCFIQFHGSAVSQCLEKTTPKNIKTCKKNLDKVTVNFLLRLRHYHRRYRQQLGLLPFFASWRSNAHSDTTAPFAPPLKLGRLNLFPLANINIMPPREHAHARTHKLTKWSLIGIQ